MKNLDNKEKIEKIKLKIKNDIFLAKKQMKFNLVCSLIASFTIMVLNLFILCLSAWALIVLIRRIIDKVDKIEIIILPTIVSLFTIFLFVLSIFIAIFKIKNKTFVYKSTIEEYHYLLLKINEEAISFEEAVEIVKKISNKKEENKKLKYKKILKNVLGG